VLFVQVPNMQPILGELSFFLGILQVRFELEPKFTLNCKKLVVDKCLVWLFQPMTIKAQDDHDLQLLILSKVTQAWFVLIL
jgi:hypothetical protein